jgi:hypothetical protein
MGSQMETWLRCTLYVGQFSSECAVVVKSFRGPEYSLFAQKSDLDYNELPTEDQPVDGWIHVDVIEHDADRGLFLVRLPQSTLENGQFLTVSASQLRRVPQRQEA